MARGKRTRLATGIYEDAYGRTIVVWVAGAQHERRYAADTTLDELRTDRRAWRDELEQQPPRAARGALTVDMAAYLDRYPKGGTARRNTKILIDHWIDAGFGARAASDVTPLEIEAQLATWAARFQPKTLNDLRRVLAAIYTARNGKAGANPVRDVPRYRVSYDDPRGQSYELIDLVLAQAPARGRPTRGEDRSTVSLTKIRCEVMAATGLHQKEVGRLTPPDLRQLDQTRVWIQGRKKGAGTKGGWLPLTRRAVAALRAFDTAHAYGPISTSSMSKSWNRWVRDAKTAWADKYPGRPWPAPADFRPYDLRHSFATAVYQATRDIRATQRLLRHKSARSTDRYAAAAVDPMAEQAIADLDRFMAVPSGRGKQGKKGPPSPSRRVATRPRMKRAKKRKM